MRGRGGYLGAKPTWTKSATSGCWRLHEVGEMIAALTWPGAGDEYFSSVSLLLGMEGSNGSVVFDDSSVNPKTVTPAGGVALSTAQKRFGGSSALFNGTSGYLSIAGGSGLAFGQGEFTVEAWIYRTNADSHVIQESSALGSSGARSNSYLWFIGDTNKLDLYSADNYRIQGTVTVPHNQWVHVALVRSAGIISQYVNGVKDGQVAFNQSFTAGTHLIGQTVDETGRLFAGYIDEFRITKGAARYQGNFSVPASAFPRS
jgi:hypothetical protein